MTACQHATSSFWGGSGTRKGGAGESNIALRPLQPPGVFLQFSVGIAILSQGKPLTVCYRERYLQHKKQQESFASCYLSNQSSRFTNMLNLRPFPQLEIEHIELRWLFLKKKKKASCNLLKSSMVVQLLVSKGRCIRRHKSQKAARPFHISSRQSRLPSICKSAKHPGNGSASERKR